MYKQINIDKLSDYKSSSKWWGFLYNASESLQSMIIKTQFHHGPPPPLRLLDATPNIQEWKCVPIQCFYK